MSNIMLYRRSVRTISGGTYLMTKPTKTEVQIISLALILALVTLAVFWGSSRLKAPQTRFNQSSLTSPENIAASNIPANPVINEPSKIAPLGLANLLEPTNVSALILGGSIAESSVPTVLRSLCYTFGYCLVIAFHLFTCITLNILRSRLSATTPYVQLSKN